MKYQVGDKLWYDLGSKLKKGTIIAVGLSRYVMSDDDNASEVISVGDYSIVAEIETAPPKPATVDEVKENWIGGWRVGFATGWVACFLLGLIGAMVWKVIFYPSY